MSEPPQPPQYGAYPGGYPPPPQQPYGGYPGYPGYSGYAGPPQSEPKNGLGLAALILAIIGLLLCWSVAGGIVLGVVAVILGFLGRGRVKRGEADNGGVAIAGIALGFVAIIAGLVFIPIYIGLFDSVGGTDYIDCVTRAGSDQAAVQECAEEFTRRVEDQFSVTVTPTP
ncbi:MULTISPECIES: DUF4190 domain-containing protein [Mycolicibacterium]|jgi:hypothetical protein|uniref:DUF4190 domain-containing protein n=1 Tax=Mycolicibacterium poriferae TaxID=39694 RepID=A0A6N4VEQ3_9MYCO|nr:MULTISPECIES: DUF4190 domain-containing protein [Mycolicibacterium]MCG7580260.1 DUF4190 domain-containing protein [Mycolicibacterium sp. OfavD-34-C]MCV7266416.1 DUF4190 domain-containing protein [Mycolicibacterium poriferae]QFS91820.1 hypothetical protein FIV07_13730 [Mycobacterium sp. THAF192]BBX52117.1 hypothetical protein MPOR_31430 [Mycolicibacterium poriferae]